MYNIKMNLYVLIWPEAALKLWWRLNYSLVSSREGEGACGMPRPQPSAEHCGGAYYVSLASEDC